MITFKNPLKIEATMIDLYTFGTPNGRKVSIMLEETGLDYKAHTIDITKNDQFDADFLKISPNNKIPAIVDHENGTKMMESGTILLYLAKKTGLFLPEDDAKRWQSIEWLMWQMGGLGPMAGQTHHFSHFNPDVSDYSKQRFMEETKRLYGVLNKQLEGKEYVVGVYSFADIAIWPWISRFEWQQIDLNNYPNIQRWYQKVAQRPAVQAGYHVPNFISEIPGI
jgi:GST-like protein